MYLTYRYSVSYALIHVKGFSKKSFCSQYFIRFPKCIASCLFSSNPFPDADPSAQRAQPLAGTAMPSRQIPPPRTRRTPPGPPSSAWLLKVKKRPEWLRKQARWRVGANSDRKPGCPAPAPAGALARSGPPGGGGGGDPGQPPR